MTDLSAVFGFSVSLDEEKGVIDFGSNPNDTTQYTVKIDEINPVLLNKYLKYPEVVYTHHRHIKTSQPEENSEYSYDMFYIPYGLLGVEFVKTHVYYSGLQYNKYDAVVEVNSGSLTVIMQRNSEAESPYEFYTQVEDIVVVNVKQGSKLAIPTGFFYSFINTSMSPVIFSMITSKSYTPVDYSVFKKEKGLACYVISKNSKVATVANPKYKMNCRLKYMSLEKLLRDESYRELFHSPVEGVNTGLFNLMEDTNFLTQFIYSR
jgi:oxalate decarboxylase/phosphoglucose isomerase-like protein (cupin superfamily)